VRLTARVPATSANLGPGFDSFGLALDLCNEVTIDTELEPGISWQGEGADELPTDGSDVVSAAMQTTAERAGKSGATGALPAFQLHGVNRIPLERGLGSSAAAVVAGVTLAHRLVGLGNFDPNAVFSVAAELEGHPDNAAAAVFGGFSIALPGGFVHRLDPHPDLGPVVMFPEGVRLGTAGARAALQSDVPMHAAVSNAAHAALAVVALTEDPSALSRALVDRIHQPYRLALIPTVRDRFDALVAEGVPVCLSGAGPSLLAFDLPGRVVPEPGEGWRVLRPGIRVAGVEITEG
jgi:homoserine kinase